MTKKTKGRAGCNQATSKTTKRAYYFNSSLSRMKAVIVTLALWGLFPMRLTKWINNHGGQRDD